MVVTDTDTLTQIPALYVSNRIGSGLSGIDFLIIAKRLGEKG